MLSENYISPHFGGSERVCIYPIEGSNIASKEYFDMPEHRPGIFAKFIKESGADVVIAGSIGERARYIFDSLRIKYFIGVLRNPDEEVIKLINGTLKSNEIIANEIHNHFEGSHNHTHRHLHNHSHREHHKKHLE